MGMNIQPGGIAHVDVREESRPARLQRLTQQVNFIDVICENISCGSTLVELADLYDLNYGKLSLWISSDSGRRSAVAAAIQIRTEWGQDVIIRELKRIAYADVREMFHEQGALKAARDWPSEAARSVASVKTKELFDNEGNEIGEMNEIKFYDKLKALELLGKNLKMFTEKHEHGLSKSLEDLLAQSNGEK